MEGQTAKQRKKDPHAATGGLEDAKEDSMDISVEISLFITDVGCTDRLTD